jgi:hypothetical protein
VKTLWDETVVIARYDLVNEVRIFLGCRSWTLWMRVGAEASE